MIKYYLKKSKDLIIFTLACTLFMNFINIASNGVSNEFLSMIIVLVLCGYTLFLPAYLNHDYLDKDKSNLLSSLPVSLYQDASYRYILGLCMLYMPLIVYMAINMLYGKDNIALLPLLVMYLLYYTLCEVFSYTFGNTNSYITAVVLFLVATFMAYIGFSLLVQLSNEHYVIGSFTTNSFIYIFMPYVSAIACSIGEVSIDHSVLYLVITAVEIVMLLVVINRRREENVSKDSIFYHVYYLFVTATVILISWVMFVILIEETGKILSYVCVVILLMALLYIFYFRKKHDMGLYLVTGGLSFVIVIASFYGGQSVISNYKVNDIEKMEVSIGGELKIVINDSSAAKKMYENIDMLEETDDVNSATDIDITLYNHNNNTYSLSYQNNLYSSYLWFKANHQEKILIQSIINHVGDISKYKGDTISYYLGDCYNTIVTPAFIEEYNQVVKMIQTNPDQFFKLTDQNTYLYIEDQNSNILYSETICSIVTVTLIKMLG